MMSDVLPCFFETHFEFHENNTFKNWCKLEKELSYYRFIETIAREKTLR